MNTAWIVLGLVFILVVIDWMIGRHTIKRCETEMVNALKHADKMVDGSQRNHFESGRLIKAEVDEKLSAQNTNVIQELRKETAGMKEWVDEMLRGTADIIKDITDQANTNMQIANDNIKIANGLIQKPAGFARDIEEIKETDVPF